MHRSEPGRLPRAPQGAFDVAPGRLGFGCASLGSRIGADAGLRALAEAYEQGVNWFDVAPAYGAGDAESLLAQFIKGRRNDLLLTTKVGIAPPRRLGAIKFAFALGRPIIGAASGLRRAFRKVSATRNVHAPLSPALIEQSIGASLRRLGTDRVDVYALHDPDPADVGRDDVARALERVVARGQARQVGVAGTADACRIARRLGAPYGVLQTGVAELAAARAELSGGTQRIVLHSMFGVDGLKRRVEKLLAQDRARIQRLVAAGYANEPGRAAAELLADYAFALNPQGVVLASMFDARHLAANLDRASRPTALQAIGLLEETIGRG